MALAICLGGLAACAFVVLALYGRELCRMARWLRHHDAASNERLTTEMPGPGFAAMARAVNGALDAAAARLGDMEGLLNSLFCYVQAADAERGLDVRPVAVLPVLADVLMGQYPAFEARGWEPAVRFEDEAFTVEADAGALARICENLVGNALRHGAGAPAITQRGRTITFANAVADGAAIDLARLFERFYRADPTRAGAGAGLGLAVVASLADALGVTYTAEVQNGRFAIALTFPDIP